MSVIFIVLPLAILIGAAGLGAFIWATRSGQFDDLDTPPVRVLFDDEEASPRSRDEQPRAEADGTGSV